MKRFHVKEHGFCGMITKAEKLHLERQQSG